MSNQVALPDAWIRRLFDRLSATYGSKFADLWRETNLDEVRSLWAQKLGGFSGEQLGKAIESLDEKPFPPTLPEFLALCRNAARRDTTQPLALPDITREQAERRIRQLNATEAVRKPGTYDFKAWARKIVAEWDQGSYRPEWAYGYGLACKALGVDRKPHPKTQTAHKPDFKSQAAADDTGLTPFP